MTTKISYIAKELLDWMGFDGAEICEEELGGRVRVDIKVKDARELIGEKGGNLAMFQHVVRRLTAKHIFPPPPLDIDINNYKKMREDVLRDFARDVGNRVRIEKKAIELDPMPAFDRRIIHLALAGFSDITTESTGEGENRYIVIHPYP